MQILELDGVDAEGVYACLPANAEDCLGQCERLFGDAEKAKNVVAATGIRSRRIAEAGVSSLDLCTAAANRLLADTSSKDSVGAVVCVTFTPERAMPCNACQAQKRLGLGSDVLAFDVNLACSGYPYGLYLAGTLAKATGRKALLLDGDVQSACLNPDDCATVPVLADAGTATLVSPSDSGSGRWKFAFLTKGEGGEALVLPRGGTISMNGFEVFRFVASDAAAFLRDFIGAAALEGDFTFVPHQANVYMIRQLAKALAIPAERLLTSGDEFGNSASASVPVTLAHNGMKGCLGNCLLAGFGGGLSASAAAVAFGDDCRFVRFDFEGKGK